MGHYYGEMFTNDKIKTIDKWFMKPIRLLMCLFAPKQLSPKHHFVIEGIPIGWIIIMIALLVRWFS